MVRHNVSNKTKYVLPCVGEVTNLYGKAAQFRDFECVANAGQDETPIVTTDSFANISATGEVVLSCKFNK